MPALGNALLRAWQTHTLELLGLEGGKAAITSACCHRSVHRVRTRALKHSHKKERPEANPEEGAPPGDYSCVIQTGISLTQH